MGSLVDVVIGIVVGAGVVAALLALLRRGPAAGADLRLVGEQLRALSAKVAEDTAVLHQRLEGIDHRMTRTQTANQDLAQGIFDTLGEVREATSAVADQAGRFTSLQDLLRAPKARGGLGEAMLGELLRQVLPPRAYTMQYRFNTGTIVDAAVHAGGRIICIDSKFPLANFQRMCDADGERERADAERAFASDVEQHIRDISTRYVVPDEGTLDFAVMYVPAEGVYGEVLRSSHGKRQLFDIAIERRVVPMSPLTMYGYLQTILFGLRCMQIEKNAEALLGFCGRLQQDVERFADEYETLGRHLTNARSKYEEGARKLDRFRGSLERASELAEDPSDADPPDDRPGDRAPLEAVGD
ncbi:MAG TPA: DNA recombination protein RmuC [Actinomycetota bacterium]|nr:DNA recombination protein RmuC [Actinomycetota bacterium]